MYCFRSEKYVIIAILLGGTVPLPVCYAIYNSIVIGAEVRFVFPIDAFIICNKQKKHFKHLGGNNLATTMCYNSVRMMDNAAHR